MATLSRRSFLTGAAAAGASMAAIAAMGYAPSTEVNTKTAETGAGGAEHQTFESSQTPWVFEIPPEPIPEDAITSEVTADLIVVGTGTSGLCCALSALQNGLDVRLISRSAAPVARGGSNFAVYSKYMEKIGAPKMDVEHVLRDHIVHQSFKVDTRKWYRFYNNDEEAINWLIDIMEGENDDYEIELETSSWGHPEDDVMNMPAGTHGWTNGEKPGHQGQPHVVEVLTKHIIDEGGTIDWLTLAEQLVREDDNTGRVRSVIAKNADNEYIKYTGTKAVVLATGDFSANRDMMAKYAPEGLDLFENWDQTMDADINKVYGGLYNGDGQRMGLWVGAAWQRVYPNPIMFSSDGYMLSWPCAMLDTSGHRFWAEGRTLGALGLMQRQQKDETYFNVWAANYAEDCPYLFAAYGAERTPADETLAGWEKAVEDGRVVKADTIEGLVAALGLPEDAVEEIKKYNRFCEAGNDEDFHKREEYLIGLDEPPYYGSTINTYRVHTVLGGLRTNQWMQVCNEEDEPIPGLYNVGTMVGDTFANAYTFQIPGINLGMNCVCFGYLTGKYIAENE